MSSTHKRIARLLTVAAWLGIVSTPGGQTQDQRPPDETADPNALEQIREFGQSEVEQDDPSSRLEWQRRAWGVVTPAFRATALQAGKEHSDKKNARGPKWVNIGPTKSYNEPKGLVKGP
jgi:hypothetical protein